MSEVTVTKKQMDAIRAIKEDGYYDLNLIAERNIKGYIWEFSGGIEPNVRNFINGMTIEQIVLAWNGHAKVGIEYVTFDEAKKALEEGKSVYWDHEGDTDEIDLDDVLENFSGATFADLLNGKFTIDQ